MNNLMKKSVSVLLAILMLLTVVPFGVFAEGETEVKYCEHENLVTKTRIEPTCTKPGEVGGLYCNICKSYIGVGSDSGKLIGDGIIPALEHKWVESSVVAPTCTEDGYTLVSCSTCNETRKENIVKAKGHKPETSFVCATESKCTVCGETFELKNAQAHVYTEVITKNPTCTEKGSKSLKCKVCGHEDTEEIAALNHDYKKTVIAATCTEGGCTKYVCSVCGDNYEEDKKPALGHDFNEWEIKKPGNCEDPQVKFRACKRKGCFVTETEVGVKDSHDYKKTVVSPTCENPGYTEYKCTKCGDTKQENLKDPLGHKILVEPDEPATCNSVGKTERRSCSRCKKVFLEAKEIPMTDHKLMIYPKVAPTCTTEGSTEGSQCEFCGKIFKEIEVIPAVGHDYEETVVKEASCVTDGVSTFRCKNCEDTYTGTVSAKGHDYDTQWTIDVQETCVEPGVKSHYCKVCGDRTDITEINALGGKHSWRTEWTIDKIATCKTAGLKSHHCSVCNAKTDITTIPKTHRYVTTTTKATASKNGLIKTVCSVCGDVSSSKTVAKIKTITLSKTSYTCDGKAKTPTVTVKDSNGKKLIKGTDYTVSYESGRKNVGTYKVVVKFKGNYSGSKTLKFTIKLAKVSGVEIKANSGKKTATLNWTKVSGVKKYVVYYSTKKDGTYKKLGTTTKVKYTTREFGKGKTIYFKVRAYTVTNAGKSAYGDYSKIVKAKIK